MANILTKDTVVLITGCSSGFGKELTLNAAHRACQVIATARNLEDLNYLCDFPNVQRLELDITDKDSISLAIERCLENHKAIDVLINNAGINYRAELLDIEDDKMRKTFETNIIGTIQMIQAVLPIMRKCGAGIIVNMSSGSGFYSTYHSCCYSISKYAIEGISENLRMSEKMHDSNIKVLTVNPGVFKTDILKKGMEHGQKIFNNPEDYSFMDGDPAAAAEQILCHIANDIPSSRLILGTDAMSKFSETLRQKHFEENYNNKLPINKIKRQGIIIRAKGFAKRILKRAFNTK